MTSHNPVLTGEEIRRLLGAVKADVEARAVFLSMPREDQLLSILGLIAWTNSQIADLQKNNTEYRLTREQREGEHNQKLMDTGEMIAIGISKALDERGQRGNKIIDSIITNLINVIVIGILILVFGNLKP